MKPVSEAKNRVAQLCSGEKLEMFTARELEKLLKIDVKTIYGYVHRGVIPYVKIQSNVRFPKHEIFDWVKKRSCRPRSMK